MHLLIPFAAPLSDAGRHTVASLPLPNLQLLLARWAEVQRDDGDAWTLSPPHERALALAFGWHGGHGLLPWAARAAQQDGIAPGDLAWGLLTPAHWHLGTDQISFVDPAGLMLDDASARGLFDAVQPLFTSEGFAMHYGAAQRWYIAHDSLATLATASLDRVIGRNVDAWLGGDPAARQLRRLQNEVQMLLYTQPINDAREARGLLPVNSVWLSGCGVAQVARGPEPVVDERLRGPALADDWAAWANAWETLDAGPVAALAQAAARGEAVTLTLCGERSSARFAPAQRSLLQRLRAGWATPSLQPLWDSL